MRSRRVTIGEHDDDVQIRSGGPLGCGDATVTSAHRACGNSSAISSRASMTGSRFTSPTFDSATRPPYRHSGEAPGDNASTA